MILIKNNKFKKITIFQSINKLLELETNQLLKNQILIKLIWLINLSKNKLKELINVNNVQKHIQVLKD